MNIVAIIQARLSSTRLPRKIFADICGKPLIEHVFERIGQSTRINHYLLATSTNPADDELAAWATQHRYDVFRGSEEDVLERYFEAATDAGADCIVRVTADDPLKDPDLADVLIQELEAQGADYVSNTLEPTYPEGVDLEVFTYEALKQAHTRARRAFEREHVTPFIWQHPDDFILISVTGSPDYSHMRWTIDTEADLAFARAVYEKLYAHDSFFTYEQVIKLLEQDEHIRGLMPQIIRNAGLLKSMEQEHE